MSTGKIVQLLAAESGWIVRETHYSEGKPMVHDGDVVTTAHRIVAWALFDTGDVEPLVEYESRIVAAPVIEAYNIYQPDQAWHYYRAQIPAGDSEFVAVVGDTILWRTLDADTADRADECGAPATADGT